MVWHCLALPPKLGIPKCCHLQILAWAHSASLLRSDKIRLVWTIQVKADYISNISIFSYCMNIMIHCDFRTVFSFGSMHEKEGRECTSWRSVLTKRFEIPEYSQWFFNLCRVLIIGIMTHSVTFLCVKYVICVIPGALMSLHSKVLSISPRKFIRKTNFSFLSETETHFAVSVFYQQCHLFLY